MLSNLKQHHVGCLVASIDDFKKENETLWKASDYSETYTIREQDVKVCFIQNTGGIFIELVEPGSENKPLSKMLAKGTSYYHIAFLSAHYDQSVKDFEEAHCHQLSEFHSEAFGGKRCSFFFHPQLKLIELIEDAL